MSDIRLQGLPFELDGKTYLLRCNMNVLADVQEAYGGDIGEALEGDSPLKSVTVFLAAMLNDYADEQGWEERWTPKTLGQRLGLHDIPKAEIMRLVSRAIVPPSKVSGSNPQDAGTDPGHSGN